MKITIESTDKLVEIVVHGGSVPGRVWEGTTDSGIPVVALVTQIASPIEANRAEFERDLQETRPPTSMADAFPTRLIL